MGVTRVVIITIIMIGAKMPLASILRLLLYWQQSMQPHLLKSYPHQFYKTPLKYSRIICPKPQPTILVRIATATINTVNRIILPSIPIMRSFNPYACKKIGDKNIYEIISSSSYIMGLKGVTQNKPAIYAL